MKTFLHEVAEDLYARYGEGLSERAILFPSRRARLFFVDALTSFNTSIDSMSELEVVDI